MTNYEKVILFNRSFGNYVALKEDPSGLYNKNLVDLKFSLINEEINEYIEAFENHDLIEIIYALFDIKYVLYGFASSFGINMDYQFKHYVKIKMKKKNIESVNLNITNFNLVIDIYRTHFSNSLNNINEFKINIKNKIFYEDLNYYKLKLIQTLARLNANISLKHFEAIKHDLCELLYFVNIIGVIIGINLDKALDIVHKSNMSKMCETEELAKKTVEWYLNNSKRYKSPSYKKNEYGYIVYNKDTGKTLKSINYTPADFKHYLE